MKTATLGKDCIVIRCDFMDKELVKLIPGRAWSQKHKVWTAPLNPEVIPYIKRIHGIIIDEAVYQAVMAKVKLTDEVTDIKLSNKKETINYRFKSVPFDHQIKAMKVVLKLWGFSVLESEAANA